MKYRLPDDVEVTGRSYDDILQAMNEQKMTPARSMERYRKSLAKRVQSLYGQQVDASSSKALVADLERIGLITRLA